MSKAQLQKQIAAITATPVPKDPKAARIRADQLQAVQDELAITPDDPKPDHSADLARYEAQLAVIPTNPKDQESLRLRYVIQADFAKLGGTVTNPVLKTVNGKVTTYAFSPVTPPPASETTSVSAPAAASATPFQAGLTLQQQQAKAKAIEKLQKQIDLLKAVQ